MLEKIFAMLRWKTWLTKTEKRYKYIALHLFPQCEIEQKTRKYDVSQSLIVQKTSFVA